MKLVRMTPDELISTINNREIWRFPMGDDPGNNYSHVVYFSEFSCFKDHIKIGRTNNLKDRMRQISRHSNADWHVMALINHVCTIDIERAFHEYFSEFRVVGEFFQKQPVVEFLIGFREGQIDYHGLHTYSDRPGPTIIRDRSHFCMSKSDAQDDSLSLAARGLLCYVLSHDGREWASNYDTLSVETNTDITTLKSIVGELIQTGHLRTD